ncbi:DivIVA domain-containing protein [Micromonospora pallida]|uniref:Cell wall synthesis protein Wag31 n=1 Tax=Micromonospora pallida TaxID=145854 RepID=A0A1C6TH55_9ACTN|nr:DivIVA domain-containing protein [Micromonospora pallida]SCL40855.1 DivIVA domain-containing protein [Micromonospora pallida]
MAQVYRSGQPYGTGLPNRLTPHEVRTREFSPRRRGVDGDEVRAFLVDVADEVADLYRRLNLLDQENERLKRVLRDWQTLHTRECRPNRGHW